MLNVVGNMPGGRLKLIVPVPFLTPRLSSHWLRLVTDVDLETARNLVDSMSNEVIAHEHRIEAVTGHHPIGFAEAARRALDERTRRLAAGTRA
jgi:hypothetical protein